jgi:hypothetical protein
MHLTKEGLLIEQEKDRVLVPLSNVVFMRLVLEEEKKD